MDSQNNYKNHGQQHGHRIMLLGSPRVQIHDRIQPLKSRYRKAIGLLAYLAAERSRPHSREQLAALFWPELDDAAARVNLRQVLASINTMFHRLGVDSPLLSTRHSIVIRPEQVSALDLSALESPISSCHESCSQGSCNNSDLFNKVSSDLLLGEFLAAYSLPGCDEFEEWLDQRRAQVQARQTNLLHTLVGCARTQGNAELAITYIQQLMRLAPDDESHLRLAMCLYMEVGQREAALKAYDAFTQRLERELGVQPQAPTVELHETIISSPTTLKNIPSTSRKTFPVIQKLSLVVVLRIQWVSLTDDPEETAQSLYDADQLAKSILSDRLNASAFSGAGKNTLFYFGWPHAQTDAAWYALRGATLFLASLKHHMPMVSARIGIHAGRMLSGADEMIPDLVGDISEEVSHLTSCAHPGEVMVSQIVQQLLGNRATCQKLGERRRQIDGCIQSVFRIIDTHTTTIEEAGVEVTGIERIEAQSPRPSYIVGRDNELLLLHQQIERAQKEFKAHEVTISGPTGIGKSALVAQWLDELEAQRNSSLPLTKLKCTPDGHSSPLLVILRHIKQQMGFHPDAIKFSTEGTTRFKHLVDKGIHTDSLLLKAISIYSIPSNKEQIIELFSEMSAYLFPPDTTHPAIFWIEDTQWLDLLTLQFIQYLKHHIKHTCLIVMSGRDAKKHDASCSLLLKPLKFTDCIHLLGALPEEIRHQYGSNSINELIQLSGGNPGFLIELAKNAVLKHRLPDTILAAFSEEIDHLKEQRDLAVLLALLGSEINLQELQLISESSKEQLLGELRELEHKSILTQPKAGHYRFTHPLLRLSLIELTTNSRQRHFKQTISTKLAALNRESLFLTEN